jgi:hypothetical protein
MLVKIGEKCIEAKVMDLEKAKEKYDDAIASGDHVAMLQECKDNKDLHQLDIGNIMPGQTVDIELEIIQPLKADSGCFEFNLPLTYFPRYHGVQNKDANEA